MNWYSNSTHEMYEIAIYNPISLNKDIDFTVKDIPSSMLEYALHTLEQLEDYESCAVVRDEIKKRDENFN